jgi:hypothetical protein
MKYGTVLTKKKHEYLEERNRLVSDIAQSVRFS